MTEDREAWVSRLAALARAHEAKQGAQREEALVTRPVDLPRLRAHLARHYAFEAPRALERVTDDVLSMLERAGVQVTHPRYFGLFNPSVPGSALTGAALRAHLNPQLATHGHAAAANEMERHALGVLGERLGYRRGELAASFTSGGQESNLTALHLALSRAFPEHEERGLRGLPADPVLYASSEAHGSIEKAARVAGLGREALRVVRVEPSQLGMDVEALAAAIDADRARGAAPFLVVATAGTTATGAIDPLIELAELARARGLWLHVDAAYGGAALLSPQLRQSLAGIERADSVTWDAHKGLSMPMGAGMFFTRHLELPLRAFSTRAGYMPAARADAPDPYATSFAWSRRFVGIELFLSLAELGLPALAARVEHQAHMGELLRARLVSRGFTLLYPSVLPVVCFTHPRIEAGELTAGAAARRVLARGRAWLSLVRLPGGRKALRACVTSYLTSEGDLEVLLDEVERAIAGR
jgi:glutamate/tyrosine decarboxylase-like PLP-dependent enzyme